MKNPGKKTVSSSGKNFGTALTVDDLKIEKERLEQASLRTGNLETRADLWMRVFRGGAVLSSALFFYGLVFVLMSRETLPVLITGILMVALFLGLSRLCKNRVQRFRAEKEELRQAYAKACDALDQIKNEVNDHK